MTLVRSRDKLIETNMIVSFNMKCTDYILNSKLFCLLVCGLASQLIKLAPFAYLWGVFYVFFFIILGSKANSLVAKVLSFKHQ
jgi:hypothetical protein